MSLKPVDLYAPESYITASLKVRQRVTNGCGTGGWLAALVPDTIYGLNIKAACNIHDWMYAAGKTAEDKAEADRVFLNNINRIIAARTRFRPLRKLRTLRAYTYYLCVHLAGGPAFWHGKNKPQNIIAATR